MRPGGVVFGKRLRKLRLAKGLTQRDVASPRYTHAYISTIEAGRRRPSPEALRHFATRLGVDVEELLSGRPLGLTEELRSSLREARVAASDGRFGETDRSLVSIASRAKRYGARRLEAGAYEIRGLILERSGKTEAALGFFERAEQVLEAERPSARADAVAGKARCLLALGDVSYAVFLLEALQRAIRGEGLPDASAVAQVDASLLDAYLDAGLLRSATEQAEALLLIAPRIRDPVRLGQMHLYLARLEMIQGRAREAERSLAAAAEAYGRSGLKTETGYTHLALGYVLSRRGSSVRARKELERARRIFEETRDVKDLTRTLVELGRLERTVGNKDEALAMLEEAISLLGDSDIPILAWAHRELGIVHQGSDDALAEKHLRGAAELFERTDERVEAALAYRLLGDVFRRSGQTDAALEAYRTGARVLPDPS